jgi:hypothetical protein
LPVPPRPRRTRPPSSMEAPTTEALVTQLGSKASNDIFVDDDHNLLNFNIVESEIVW